jgi:Arc/MetJ family transcription regulator
MPKRITIEIDEALLAQATRALGCRTIRRTVVTKMDNAGVVRDDLATVAFGMRRFRFTTGLTLRVR